MFLYYELLTRPTSINNTMHENSLYGAKCNQKEHRTNSRWPSKLYMQHITQVIY